MKPICRYRHHVKRPELRRINNTRSFCSQRMSKEFLNKISNGPSLRDFIQMDNSGKSNKVDVNVDVPHISHQKAEVSGRGKKVYMETYGCQMNVNDSEIVLSILQSNGYQVSSEVETADVILLNTCAIREKAENKIWDRLGYFKNLKKKEGRDITVGVLGCMAERLKNKLLESDKLVDIVVGPDAYRSLPELITSVDEVGQPAINVLLSQEETYADITPVRTTSNGVSAFVSIMRGCNNMCSYCIVPFTRGRERSRPVSSIEDEIRHLSDQSCSINCVEGYKEVVLLGQNVNSYNFIDEHVTVSDPNAQPAMSAGFRNMSKVKPGGIRFAELLERCAKINKEMRIRFTSPHPKDFPDELLGLINAYPNLCKSLHVPAQSGSSAVLERMRRGYTREAYIALIDKIKEIIPGCAISSDFISGFCGETEDEHKETLTLMDYVKYDQAFMFAYSLRERTHAHRNYKDDVPPEVKNRRLQEVIAKFNIHALSNNSKEIGKQHLVLVDGYSKKSKAELTGRTDTNKSVVFPDVPVPASLGDTSGSLVSLKQGDYVAVTIEAANTHSLRATAIARTTLSQYYGSQR